jgi:triosephosphate isomerase (TIM)
MKKYIIANFKMELSLKNSLLLLKKYNNYSFKKEYKIIICPDFLSLASFKDKLKNIELGAQNCANLDYGALTGEVSPLELKKLGINYIIVGHSERRFLNEDNILIAEKSKIALKSNLKVILCVGETLQEKKQKISHKIIKEQVVTTFDKLTKKEIKNVIIAYEPRWAIGQKKPCLASDASLMHQFIKRIVKQKYNLDISVIYGGSINEKAVIDFKEVTDIDGFLIGRASLDFNKFKQIVNLC